MSGVPSEFTFVERPSPTKKPRGASKSRKWPPYVPKPRTERSLECANCGDIFKWHRDRAFCSVACKSIADVVRYRRSVRTRYPDGAPDDVIDAIRTKMAHTLSGGYDKEARRLSPERRAEVWKRDGGKCVLCKADGDEIDHIDDSSGDLTNLRLLCKPCHHEITDSRLVPIPADDVETEALVLQIRHRVGSPVPLLACDAPEWSEREVWRHWVREHER